MRRVGSLSLQAQTPKRRIIMETKKRLIIVALSVAIVAFGTFSCVSSGVTKIPLVATKMQQSAVGTTGVGDKSVSVQANGLKPNSVYTVWFVNMDENMKPKAHTGAGKSPYMFKTNSSGAGSYKSQLQESPFGKWQMMMIMLHPNGDPTDMSNTVGALSAKLMR